LYKLVATFSKALDLSDLRILNHSERVAYIVLKLAATLGLTEAEKGDAVLAALVHDIGISSTHWRVESHSLRPPKALISEHCIAGGQLLRKVKALAHLADIVICHHDLWDETARTPVASRLIHLADRIEVQINPDRYILGQVDSVKEQIKQLSSDFWPTAYEAFAEISHSESFWLDLSTGHYQEELADFIGKADAGAEQPDLQEIAGLFATVIDRKSPFTSRHSHGVAETARWLATAAGLNPEQVKDMQIAGLLHDLGKLAVPDLILEFPGRLSPEQMLVIKQHTYHTYHLLDVLSDHPHIKEWAAFHHERLNGTGYPFRLDASQLSLGARIMAVADIFQALHEDRPYRKGLSLSEITPIMTKMADNNEIDPDLTDLLLSSYPGDKQ